MATQKTAAQIIHSAIKSTACDLVSGKETDDELVEIFFSPQGVEYCSEIKLPDIKLFELGDSPEIRKKGLYVNQKVEVDNPDRIALVGKKAHGKLRFDELKEIQVILLHGATAEIEASGYAVVRIIDPQNGAKVTLKDRAIILR